jgi:molybdopterin-guanine dinucleotide biosynthesis protein A
MWRTTPSKEDITGVILAGGRGRRLGGLDKGLIQIGSHRLIERVLESLEPQVATLMISANRNRERYEQYGVPVVADSMPHHQGPLVGILSAMRAARTNWIVSVPCDGPLLPLDLVERLVHALSNDQGEIAIAVVGERLQPVYSLQPVALADGLQSFLDSGERRASDWAIRHRLCLADFADQPLAFANLNTPEDAARIAEHL